MDKSVAKEAELVGELYRATARVKLADYRAWALARLGELLPFDAALWASGHLSTLTFHTRTVLGVDASLTTRLLETLAQNPLTPVLLDQLGREPLGALVDMAEVIDDAAFHASEVYRQCFAPLGIERILSSIHLDARSGIFTVLSLYRRDRERRFSAEEKQRQQRLLFHLRNAASHAAFLALGSHRRREPDEVCALCDRHGIFHEVESAFLDCLEQHGAVVDQRFPWALQDQQRDGLHVRCQPLGDLIRVSLWPRQLLDALSERERAIVERIVQGMTAKAIGKELELAGSTVSNHLYNACRKLGVHSRGELRALLARP